MAYRDEFRSAERDVFWSLPRVALVILLALVFLYGIGFFATGGDLAIYSFWAPKQANVERQVFENTQSYVQGKIQNLSQLCYAEQQATGAQKSALDSEIRNESVTIQGSKLPTDEQACVDRAKGL